MGQPQWQCAHLLQIGEVTLLGCQPAGVLAMPPQHTPCMSKKERGTAGHYEDICKGLVVLYLSWPAKKGSGEDAIVSRLASREMA